MKRKHLKALQGKPSQKSMIRLEETQIMAHIPDNKAYSAYAHLCPECPYFSARRNDLNTHISACHRPNTTNELNIVFDDFIESCELPYLESPMYQIQGTNEDSQLEITSEYDTNADSKKILSTQPGLAQLSRDTSSFFESLTMYMEKPNKGHSIFEQYKDYQSNKEDLKRKE